MSNEKAANKPNKIDLLEARIEALEDEIVRLQNQPAGQSANSALILSEPQKPAVADVPFTADGVRYRLKFLTVKYRGQTCSGQTFAENPALAVQFLSDFPHLVVQQVEE